MSPFILHFFSFSLTDEQQGEKLLKRCWWIATAYTYYVTLMAKCTNTWLHHPSIKIINKHNIFAMCQFKSARMVSCRDLRICVFLGCDLPIQLLLKSLSSTMRINLVDQFHYVKNHITNYEICNIPAWTNRFPRFLPVIYLYSCFFG